MKTPVNLNSTLFPDNFIDIDISPLVTAIAKGDSVAFVGAGASMSAGLPSWYAFLRRCLTRARESSPDRSRWEFAGELLDNGDYLTAAELLQRGIGSQLEEYIWDEFGTATTPSAIHAAISRVPFSTAVTTNYDRLLESAYSDHPAVRTWLDAAAIFSAFRHRRFCVIKTHGDVGNRPSLVLTKTEYRDLVQKSAAFNSCLRMLLSLRTFLFVGYSLRDHDLLSIMDEARLMYDEDFGPHFAILFKDEVDDGFIDFLRDSYAVHTIVCPTPPENLECPDEFRTEAVVRVLREISGRVSVKQLEFAERSSKSHDATFTFRDEANRQLQFAVSLTGSLRGDVCIVKDEHLQSMKRIAMTPSAANECDSESENRYAPRVGDGIVHDSVIGRVFLTWRDHNDFAYISDVCHADEQLRNQGFTGTTYRSCHPDVLSEIACPILADGHRVGVLNVESERKEAFTSDHLNVVQELASRIGIAQVRLKHREVATRRLAHYHTNFAKFNGVLRASRLLNHFDMQFILYKIDYNNGELIAHYDEDRISDDSSDPDVRDCIEFGFRWGFHAKSLASLAFRERRRVVVDDAEKELTRGSESRVAGRGLKVFGIKGPLVSMPITVGGHVAGVLVGWSDRPQKLTSGEFGVISERVHRMAQLVANDPVAASLDPDARTPSEQLTEFINKGLQTFDNGNLWTPKMLKTKKFRAGVIGVTLSSLIQTCIGLTRVRLWLADHASGENPQYRLVASLTRPGYGVERKRDVNAYVGAVGRLDDPYVQYTLTRYANDAYARHQHESMFDQPDVNHDLLDKAEGGAWLVGPIVRWNRNTGKKHLRAYISADSHVVCGDDPSKTVEPNVTDDVRVFQRSAVDVVTDVLEEVVLLEKRPRVPVKLWLDSEVFTETEN